MVETKKDLTIKEVLGILVGTFSFLFTSIANGMPTMNAIIISAIVAGAGFLFAWFGVTKISLPQLGTTFATILKIAADKEKTAQTKLLEIELTIKRDLELLNISWVNLNEGGEGALKTITEVAEITSNLPEGIGGVAKVAADALKSLQPAEQPLP